MKSCPRHPTASVYRCQRAARRSEYVCRECRRERVQRWRENHPAVPKPRFTAEKFWSRVEKTDGCWLWTGHTGAKGYAARIGINGRYEPAYRIAFCLAGGVIPAGFELDHLCRNPRCVRPDHLEAVSHRENVLRGISMVAENIKKTHCLRGHPFDEQNTGFTTRGGRVCRACRSAHWIPAHNKRRRERRQHVQAQA